MRIERIASPKETTEHAECDLSLMDDLIKKYRNKKGNLIPLLQGAQNLYGFIPPEVFEHLHRKTGLPLNDMYGVATFYAQFRLEEVGKYIIKMCHGTACHVQNVGAVTSAIMEALKVVDGGTTDDRLFTLETVACLGCCSLAPVMMIGEDTYGKLSGKDAVKVVKEIRLAEAKK